MVLASMWKSDEKCLTSSCLHCILSLVLQISRIPTTEPPQKLTEEVDFECLRKFQGPRSFLCVIRCNSVVYEKVRKYRNMSREFLKKHAKMRHFFLDKSGNFDYILCCERLRRYRGIKDDFI